MKYNLLLFTAIIFSISVTAQTKISISGKLTNKEKLSVIHLKNIDDINIPITVTPQNTFAFTTEKLERGFYTIDEVGTIYLNTGYNIRIQPTKSAYIFTGKGSAENTAFKNAKEQLSNFLPTSKSDMRGEFSGEVYLMDLPVFFQKLDSFEMNGKKLLNKSSDTFFVKYATLDLQFYKRHLISIYNIYYGMDMDKTGSVSALLSKLDFKAPGVVKKIDSLNNLMYIKRLPTADKMRLHRMLYDSLDRNNEILFKNSYWYREAFKNFFTSRAFTPKYFKLNTTIKRETADINKLEVAKGEISNPYILSYFLHGFTATILKTTRDTSTLNKYYNEFVSGNPKPEYLQNITEIYTRIISFADNMPAPDFAFKNLAGKTVTLESLRGRFIYIDVWATWCGPCKAEIPHLKKLEAAYKNKNIQFVSLSVDIPADEKKWKNFIVKNKLSGIQLISDNAFESDFINKMSINSIPRFILIDTEGKIIYADALRPSDAGLRIQLNKLL